MSPQPESNRHRYLKAKFSILLTPKFWLSMTGASLISIFAWQYFSHPEWLEIATNFIQNISNKSNNPDNQNTGNNDIPPEELGQLVLDNDLTQKELNMIETANQPPTENQDDVNSIFTIPSVDFSKTSGKQSSQKKDNNNDTSANSSNNYTSKLNLVPNVTGGMNMVNNPFITVAQASLSTYSLLNPSMINTSTSNNQEVSSNVNISPQAVGNSSTINNAINTNNYNPPTVQSTNTNSPRNNPTEVVNNSSNNVNSYSYLNQGQSSPIIYTPAPLNPPVQQVTPTTVNYYSPTNTNINSVPTTLIPVGTSQVQSSQVQPSQITPVIPPANTERTVPGRYIGNGEINTFSNP